MIPDGGKLIASYNAYSRGLGFLLEETLALLEAGAVVYHGRGVRAVILFHKGRLLYCCMNENGCRVCGDECAEKMAYYCARGGTYEVLELSPSQVMEAIRLEPSSLLSETGARLLLEACRHLIPSHESLLDDLLSSLGLRVVDETCVLGDYFPRLRWSPLETCCSTCGEVLAEMLPRREVAALYCEGVYDGMPGNVFVVVSRSEGVVKAVTRVRDRLLRGCEALRAAAKIRARRVLVGYG